uniref:Uncharacterized protein n=1 Tax=Solanum tuberosum TaxID=4113 RepID=M1B090_SOLTU
MDCRWINGAKIMMCTRLGVQLPCRGVYKTIKWIKRRRWKQFQKEVIAAAWGALVYDTWIASHKRVFNHQNVNV